MIKTGIIGMGNMGEAILKALLDSGFKKKAILGAEAKSTRAEFIETAYGLKCSQKPEEIAGKTDYIIVAVKPQDSKTLLRTIAPALTDKKVLISIMAGITTSSILSIVGKPVKVVRVMPNICVKVGEGAIGLASNQMVDAGEVEEVKKMFLPLGKIVDVNEDLMDAVTALGGSGPAFFLLFLEAMIDAGVKLGIPRDKSSILSAQVINGTMRMLEVEGIHPVLLKEMITSPGGTTIAGLASLDEGAFKGKLIRAIEEACKRSKELSA
ncbi:MAG: Pyrroline-5-carboxylate reductase [Syntrophorhabdus sp. PtaU1.Bin050]|nr:MAG: Pyrroline-5-carboxylate reductase [Syntrophorhabdus sp. PtaU1.Bin050]